MIFCLRKETAVCVVFVLPLVWFWIPSCCRQWHVVELIQSMRRPGVGMIIQQNRWKCPFPAPSPQQKYRISKACVMIRTFYFSKKLSAPLNSANLLKILSPAKTHHSVTCSEAGQGCKMWVVKKLTFLAHFIWFFASFFKCFQSFDKSVDSFKISLEL